MGLLELQCTFIWVENQKKEFSKSSPVEALILFNEEHQGLLKLQVPLGWEWGRMELGERWGYLQERALWGRFLLVDCFG